MRARFMVSKTMYSKVVLGGLTLEFVPAMWYCNVDEMWKSEIMLHVSMFQRDIDRSQNKILSDIPTVLDKDRHNQPMERIEFDKELWKTDGESLKQDIAGLKYFKIGNNWFKVDYTGRKDMDIVEVCIEPDYSHDGCMLW